MAIRSQSDITASFFQFLQARFPLIDTTSGRALSSLLFDSIATELATAYDALQQVQIEQGVSAPTTSSDSGMDELAYNWNLTRRGAIAATGIITFQKLTLPTINTQIGSQDGSGGVIVATARQTTGTVVLFVTTSTVYMTPATALNPTTGLYEVDAPVQCISLGAVGNVDVGLITVLQSSVPGIDFVTNKISTTGGREEEDNTTLANRIQKKVQGLQPGIERGLVSAALAQDTVLDAVVVGPNDAEFVRANIGGAVDLIVLGELITSSVQVNTYTFNQPFVSLANRPVTQITSVSAIVGLTQSTLLQGVDYAFTQDLTGPAALSSQSSDQLSWLSGQHPNVGAATSIQYQYDKSIAAIQAVLDATNEHFITASVLVKRATQVLVDMSLTVRKTSGADSNVVAANVATAISNLINNLGLGDPVQQSDLVVAIKQASGIDSILLPFSTLHVRGGSGVADISPTKYQYPRVDAASITVTVQ